MNPRWIPIFFLIIFSAVFAWRSYQVRASGIEFSRYGKEDIGYRIIGPVAVIYFYHVLALPLGWPGIAGTPLVEYPLVDWLGVGVIAVGLGLVLWGLFSFKNSMRIGIDSITPGSLITTGAFSLSRNPLYTGFNLYLLGQFLIYPSWFFLVFLLVATFMLNRQIRQEETFLRTQHGELYERYSQKVRRYF